MLILIIGALIILIGVAGIYFLSRSEAPKAEDREQISKTSSENIVIASTNPNIIPSPPPGAEDLSKLDKIESILQAASANYNRAYLDQLPEYAFDKYLLFLESEDEAERQTAAQEFHRLLTTWPGHSTEQGFIDFSSDIKNHFESTLGRPLF